MLSDTAAGPQPGLSAPATWRLRLATAIWAAHSGFVAFFVIAWALPWRWALWATLVGAALLQLQWWLNADQCVLTTLERRLRGLASAPASDETGFISGVLALLLRRSVSQRWADVVTYGVLYAGAALAALRLARD